MTATCLITSKVQITISMTLRQQHGRIDAWLRHREVADGGTPEDYLRVCGKTG